MHHISNPVCLLSSLKGKFLGSVTISRPSHFFPDSRWWIQKFVLEGCTGKKDSTKVAMKNFAFLWILWIFSPNYHQIRFFFNCWKLPTPCFFSPSQSKAVCRTFEYERCLHMFSQKVNLLSDLWNFKIFMYFTYRIIHKLDCLHY